eukprot:gene3274-3489_t
MKRIASGNSIHPCSETIILEQYEIGIVKNKNSDIYYDEFPLNYQSFDNMLNSSPYQLLPKSTTPTRLLLLSPVIDESIWKKDFYQPILEILEEANQKRRELYGHLITNPYFPWHKHPNHLVSRFYYSIMEYADIPYCGGCVVFLGSLFIDIVSCRLQLCRGSEKEKQFLQVIIEQYPEYDTRQIDDTIKDKINLLTKHLINKYEQLKFYIKIGQEQVVDEKNSDFYMQDYYIIVIEKYSSMKTEDASDFV